MEALDTIYNGASVEAAEAIDSIKPPYAQWTTFEGTVTTSRDGGPIQTLRVYKIIARRITSGAICGPMGAESVATAIFSSDGGRVSPDAIARLERNEYHAGVPTGWRMNCNAERVIRDLLRALAGSR